MSLLPKAHIGTRMSLLPKAHIGTGMSLLPDDMARDRPSPYGEGEGIFSS